MITKIAISQAVFLSFDWAFLFSQRFLRNKIYMLWKIVSRRRIWASHLHVWWTIDIVSFNYLKHRFSAIDGFICARRFRWDQQQCFFWKWIYAKKATDRCFRGNQSLVHEGIFFERFVCASVSVPHFFTHSREAPSLIDRVQDRVLALLLLKFQIKLWDILDFFVTGYDGKGARASTRHTLSNLTLAFFSIFKMSMS